MSDLGALCARRNPFFGVLFGYNHFLPHTESMSEYAYDELLDFASALARDAGTIMRRYFHDADQQITRKQDATVVTVADKAINDLVIQRVSMVYPDHGVLGEEASDHDARRELWVCDPIDGTNGFTIGEPTAMFSLAFVVEGVPLLAVAYDPFQDRLYSAIMGRGALCNGKSVQVNTAASLQDGVIGLGGSFAEVDRNIQLYRQLQAKGADLRMLGGLVFKGSLVAEGKIAAVLFPYKGAHDIAALKLLVEEAGGTVTDVDGNDQRYDRPLRGAIISNGAIHNDLVHQLATYGVETYLNYDIVS